MTIPKEIVEASSEVVMLWKQLAKKAHKARSLKSARAREIQGRTIAALQDALIERARQENAVRNR